MNYFGIDLFEKILCEGVSGRVAKFVQYMRERFTKDPELNQNKTTQDWMLEYVNWSKECEREKMIKKYLEEADED